MALFFRASLVTISIHALRGEGDDKAVAENYKTIAISIHALRGEGDAKPVTLLFRPGCISIHALRGEGDLCELGYEMSETISIHALRGEGDPWAAFKKSQTKPFQSTPSVGRATSS